MRRLLGRYLALKAREYRGVVEVSDEESGLGDPLVSIQMLGSGIDLQLQIGKAVSEGQRYFSISGLTERVIARDGLLEDYTFSTEMTRNPLLLDYLEDIEGVVQIQFEGEAQSSTLLHNGGWMLNGLELPVEKIETFIRHLSDFRVANWGGTENEWNFVPHKDKRLPRVIKFTHSMEESVLLFGEKIEKNMALTESDPPQIVQYRQVRIQSPSREVDVLIEDHWLSELVEQHEQLSTPAERGD